jgi:hypothetical protein
MRLFGALAVAAFLLVHPSLAHDSWISNDGLKNPATEEWCCGRGDCGIVMPTPKVTAVGWVIHGDVIIDISGRRIRVDEVIPYNEVLPSPDGYFWRCHTVENDEATRIHRGPRWCGGVAARGARAAARADAAHRRAYAHGRGR